MRPSADAELGAYHGRSRGRVYGRSPSESLADALFVFKLFVLIVFRVGTTNTPRMKMTVVVVLAVGVGLGQPHDGLGVGAHGGQRDLCVARAA